MFICPSLVREYQPVQVSPQGRDELSPQPPPAMFHPGVFSWESPVVKGFSILAAPGHIIEMLLVNWQVLRKFCR